LTKNRVEIAIDFVFKSWAKRDDTWHFLHRHIVRRWHGKNREIRLIKSNPAATMSLAAPVTTPAAGRRMALFFIPNITLASRGSFIAFT
jgi:hypothetical protein